MVKTLGVVLGSLFVFGCASTDAPKPTHYWQGANQTSHQYKMDNYNCETQADLVQGPNGALDMESDSFAAYKDCMIRQGYTLRTY